MDELKRVAAFVAALALILILASCKYSGAEKENSERNEPSVENNMISSVNEKNLDMLTNGKRSEVIGDYPYPENPAEQLRIAFESDKNIRGIPMEISNVEKIEFEDKECTQIKITFTDGNENMCVISFVNKYLDYGYEETLDGRENPSFTIAFKDHDNSQDMITVLTLVIKYISPDLSFEEAERLALKQDDTISTDGYSMPQDIGGYQIQARYTNPHVFVRTPYFESKFGVNVRAIRQLWRGTINLQQCKELINPQDDSFLDVPYWDTEKHSEIVYADFIVKNLWQKQSYLHGETWVMVDVESMTGQQYAFSLDTWEFPKAYEFGVGQLYTMFIQPNRGLVYAIQRSESAQFNSRGEVQPIDYPIVDWKNPIRRIEPEGEGTVYDVSFFLKSQSYGEQFAALHGNGIGEKQWPNDPAWDGYTFVGWYDNWECKGSPYTKDTPIYQDTSLCAKWKYAGPGGIWPRAHRGDIQGIEEGSYLSAGQKLTITAKGYNMNLETPKDQRFRWYPVTWRLSDGASGSFSNEAPFQAVLSLNNKDAGRLYITYFEETFDGVEWQATGQLREVEEITFRIE